jgi:hypothetical protein
MAAAPLAAPLASSLYAADDPETLKILAKYKECTDKGLEWLRKNQERNGAWRAQGGQYPIAMTGLAGLALLCEGSTPHQGKYSKQIDDAVEFLMSKIQASGLIGNPQDQAEQQRYMYGHGFALMFLASVYGEETDNTRRGQLKKRLTTAVEFTYKAQTKLGGWGYVSAADGQDFDEGSVTITQVQALRAARNAGIVVPPKCLEMAKDYLKKSTQITKHDPDPKKREGGVIYSLRQGGGNVRPPLTAAGIACMFNAGEYDGELAMTWLNHCQKSIPIDMTGRDSFGHWEYTHFYYAQVLYVLGEDRHGKLRPDLKKIEDDTGQKVLLKWSRYREVVFKYLDSKQNKTDGSWTQGYIGPVYTTALHLVIMQLDKGNVPILQR